VLGLEPLGYDLLADPDAMPTPDVDADGGAPAPDAPPDAQIDDAGEPDVILPVDADSDADAGPPPCNGALACERIVFVTSQVYTGAAVNGITGANNKCQASANQSTNPRVKGRAFRAWISTDASAADVRLPHGTMAYVRPNGTVVATDWTQLTDGTLDLAIQLDEFGVSRAGTAWTGTTPDGASVIGQNCVDWTSAAMAATGRSGAVVATGATWTSDVDRPCNLGRRLYCVEY
jgi:hypothetical protein